MNQESEMVSHEMLLLEDRGWVAWISAVPRLLKHHHTHQLGDRTSSHKKTHCKNDFSKLSVSFQYSH